MPVKQQKAPKQFSLNATEMNQALKAAFLPESANAEERTINVVFSAGTKVIRASWFSDPYYLQLKIDEDSIDLGRLNNGAPLLDSHNQYRLKDQIGVVEKAWIEDGLAYATIRFSKREEVEPVWQDVLDGIHRGISPGVHIQAWEELHSEEEKYHTILATKWEPLELSLCPVQADPGAHTLSDKSTQLTGAKPLDNGDAKMSEPVKKEEKQPSKEEKLAQDKAVREAAISAERLRSSEIRKAVAKANLGEKFANELIENGVELDEARKQIIDRWADADSKEEVKTQLKVVVTRDEGVTRVESMENALMHRANPNAVALSEAGRQYRGLSLMEMGRKCLDAHGVDHEGKSKMEVAKLAMHSTSDFPSVLANATGKALRKAYESAPQTFRPWVSETSASDFKTMSRNQLHGLSFAKVPEGAEITRGSISDSKEEYALATYARIIAITRQTIINDDLGAFSRLPRMFGNAAANLESDIVYAILTANAAMADNVALFHASHGNLGSAGVISETTLSEMRADMRVQTDDEDVPLNVDPRFLLVPAALETTARKYVATEMNPTSATDVNVFKGSFQVLVEPRLDNASTTAWYGVASPEQIDTIEIAYLDGQRGLYLEERVGFDVDGIEVKGRLDFAAKAIDWRGLYKNAGA